MDITKYNTGSDMLMVLQLMKNPTYNIPPHLRQKMIEGASEVIHAPDSFKDFSDAAKLVLEMEKRNIDYMKLIVPKTVRHEHVADKSTEELIVIAESYERSIPLIPEILR